jgi:hypothetical protein
MGFFTSFLRSGCALRREMARFHPGGGHVRFTALQCRRSPARPLQGVHAGRDTGGVPDPGVSQALAFMFSNITDYNALYGSIGAILAVQFWIYLNMIVLLIGYELNTSIVRARASNAASTCAPAQEAP